MSRVNETNATIAAAARQKLRLLDHVHVTGEDGAADLAARDATAKGAAASREKRVGPPIVIDEGRSLIRDDGGGFLPSVAVPEQTRRSDSDELAMSRAFSSSPSTRPTGHVRLPHAENLPSPQLLAAQEAWDRAFEALFHVNPATLLAQDLSKSSSSGAAKNKSGRLPTTKEGGESGSARPHYGADGGRDGPRDRNVSSNSTAPWLSRPSEAERTVTAVCSSNKIYSRHSCPMDAQTVPTVSPATESHGLSPLSRSDESALLPNAVSVASDSDMNLSAPSTQRHRCVRAVDRDKTPEARQRHSPHCRPKLPAVDSAATSNDSQSARVHGDLRTFVLDITENAESRSGRKGDQRRETPALHPNRSFIPSFSCSSGAQMIERPAPGPKTSAGVSAMPSRSSRSSGEKMSVESALLLRKPAVAFAATTNESPSVQVHGDPCTWALETTETVESRSACRKGAQRRETPVAHPNRFLISSLLCASGAQTTERAASASHCAVVSSSLSGSSDVSMLRPPVLVHPNIEVASVATSKVSQPARARVTPNSTPSVQRRLPERAWVDLNRLDESIVRLESRTTHRADKAQRRAVTLDARITEELPFDEAECRRDETQVAAAATRETFAAAAARDDAVASQYTLTTADIESKRSRVKVGLKQQEAVSAYPDADALRARTEIPSFPPETIPKGADAGIVDRHFVSSVLQRLASRTAHRTDALCESSGIDFTMHKVRIDEEKYLKQEAASSPSLQSRLPRHMRSNGACVGDGTSGRRCGEQEQTQAALSRSSACAEMQSFHRVSSQLSPVPIGRFRIKWPGAKLLRVLAHSSQDAVVYALIFRNSDKEFLENF
ncbi:hypothetical protein K438DRAFT_2027867 [Mycena galopus ATCC 62051]|nr:hypothetical protein K438DRAFT_2027867 [Mycena galopus ATCC 62051]